MYSIFFLNSLHALKLAEDCWHLQLKPDTVNSAADFLSIRVAPRVSLAKAHSTKKFDIAILENCDNSS